jgi:hypothetical protein
MFLGFLLGSALLLGLAGMHSRKFHEARAPVLAQTTQVVADLELTDLCLTTEARYTRHLSQADRHAPFQSHPLSLDLFPSGSIIDPPEFLRDGP